MNGSTGMMIVMAVGLTVLTGCSRRQTPSPPKIYYGQTPCDNCKMIVSDQRFAAGAVVRDPDGRLQSLAFDDIGCLLGYQKAHPQAHFVARYVRGYSSDRWLAAETATYVHGDDLQTPMASGVVALGDVEAARAIAQRLNGRVSTWGQLTRTTAAPSTEAHP